MKYLIFGRRGWLAQKFKDFFVDVEISKVDITDLKSVRKELNRKKPKVVINAAGATGRPNIDWCEDHKLETIAANVTGPLNILQACQEKEIYWVHLSSGCIFQGSGAGKSGFKEDDTASPPSFYSWSKFWIESILKYFPVLILRLRLPIDVEPNPRNLIDKLIKYPKVINAENSVTVIPDFLRAAKKLIEERKTGIYNMTNPGTISPSAIMKLYKKIVDPSHKFETVAASKIYKYGLAKATRSNCMLNTKKLAGEKILLKPINERIIEIMNEYKANLISAKPKSKKKRGFR